MTDFLDRLVHVGRNLRRRWSVDRGSYARWRRQGRLKRGESLEARQAGIEMVGFVLCYLSWICLCSEIINENIFRGMDA